MVEKIGKYEVNRLIGRGGMAEIHECVISGARGFKKIATELPITGRADFYLGQST